MDWFKMPCNARVNACLSQLSDGEHRVWFRLMCFICETHDGINLPIVSLSHPELADVIAAGDRLLMMTAIEKMEQYELIDLDKNGAISIVDWDTYRPSNDAIPARMSSSVWQRIRNAVFARDEFTCAYCGRSGVPLDCDHVFPKSRGGSNEMDNLTAACQSCNRSKRDRTPEEWKR